MVKSLDYLDTLGHRGKNNPITIEEVVHYLSGHVEEHAIRLVASRRLIWQDKKGLSRRELTAGAMLSFQV